MRSIPIYVVILFCLSVVGMNLLSSFQLVNLEYLALNAGICVSWFAFLVLDVVTKHFGAKAANFLSILAIMVNMTVGLIFFIISLILKDPSFDIFVFSQWSILLASTVAFIISALSNNYINIFVGKKIKRNPNGRIAFLIRSYVSTLFGQILDNFLFAFLAFYLLPMIPGATQVNWTIQQVIGASIICAFVELASEAVFAPIGYRIVKYWREHNVGEEYIRSNYKLELLSASELGDLVNRKVLTPTYVLDYYLRRIEKYNGRINAFTYLEVEYAKNRAKEIEERINKGEYVGPFAGVPFALKDCFDSKKGWWNSAGGVKCIYRKDQYDSFFVTAMENLGGIAIGKCNAPSFGFRGVTDNYMYGPTINPFNKKYNIGGSSGGSAAAVCGGLVPIAEGGDAGGSIRIPACYSNTFGFVASSKTLDLPVREELTQDIFPYCMNGCLSKTVLDTAILLKEMTNNKVDYLSKLDDSIEGLRVGYTDDFGIFEVEDEVKERVYNAAKLLEKKGATVHKISFPLDIDANDLTEQWCLNISLDSSIEYKKHKDIGTSILRDVPPEFIEYNEKALKASKKEINKYHEYQLIIKKTFNEVFKDYDIILSPVSAVTGVLNSDDRNTKGPEYINGKKINPLIGFCLTYIVNFVVNPCASTPIGLNKNKVPIGIQIIGKEDDDSRVLNVAKKFEEINPWRDYYDISYKCKK